MEKFPALSSHQAKLNLIIIKSTGCGGIAILVTQLSVRDLAIYLSKEASFHVHATKLTMKRRRLTGWILRAFETGDGETMIVLWRILILKQN